MSIVDVENLKDYMSNFDMDSDQESAAEIILAGLQKELERYLNRPILTKTITETVPTDTVGLAVPSYTPVISIIKIHFKSSFFVNSVSQEFDITDYAWMPEGIYTGIRNDQVTLTYEAGLGLADDELDDLKLGILRAAAREMTTRHDDTLSVKELAATNEGEPPPQWQYGWRPEELEKFDRLRKRVIL